MDLTDPNNGGNTRWKQFWKMELPKFYGTSAYTLTGPFTTARGSCPNIVLIDKVDSRVKIIDIAVLWDANIESKYGEKVDHYKYLAIELSSL